MTNIVDEFPELANADPIALVNRADVIRKELQDLKPHEAPEEEQITKLRELSYIAGILRRRTVPESAADKKKKTTKRAPTPTLDSIL